MGSVAWMYSMGDLPEPCSGRGGAGRGEVSSWAVTAALPAFWGGWERCTLHRVLLLPRRRRTCSHFPVWVLILSPMPRAEVDLRSPRCACPG